MKFSEIKKLTSDLPISSVIQMWDEDAFYNKCPFHDDENSGSFKYKDEEKGGIFKCFVCETTGDKYEFVMKYDSVDFKEAVLRIALRFDLISREEYLKHSKNPDSKKESRKVEVKKVKKITNAEKKPDVYLNDVYTTMRKVFGLTEDHKKYLIGRGLEEKELSQYFSFGEFNEAFYRKMFQEKGFSRTDFIGVPGFYLNEQGNVLGKESQGIGIPMMNAKGLITGVQLRKDRVEGKSARYIFFSSTKENGGCSVGTIADIIDANVEKGSVFITEGHFKALQLRKHFGCTSISVQGVNNTACLDEEIPSLLEKMEIRRFVIAFDADMIHNKYVFKAAKKLQQQLEKFNIPAGFMVWDEKYGKGCDDVILNGNSEHFKFVKTLKEE